LERFLTEKPFNDFAWRAVGLKKGADVNVRAKDGAQHRSRGPTLRLPGLLASPCLRIEGKIHGLLLCQRSALLPPEDIKPMSAGESPDLIQPFNRHKRRQGLALSLDNEFVVSQRNAIE